MLPKQSKRPALSKKEYRQRLPALQQRLYELGHEVFQTGTPVMVVLEGWATAGKGGAIHALTERMDARGFRVVTVSPPRTSESRYPWLWRFWRDIPARGQIVIFDNSWYRRVLIDRVSGAISKDEGRRGYDDIRRFERQLANDGTVIVKIWLHIRKKEQARRFRRLQKRRLTAWQITDEDALQHRSYGAYRSAAERMLARTDTVAAPWTIVAAHDRYHARIAVCTTLVRALEAHLATLTASGPAGSEASHA